MDPVCYFYNYMLLFFSVGIRIQNSTINLKPLDAVAKFSLVLGLILNVISSVNADAVGIDVKHDMNDPRILHARVFCLVKFILLKFHHKHPSLIHSLRKLMDYFAC